MPVSIDVRMFAPCGMHCTVCYKHARPSKEKLRCLGCLNQDEGKPAHCRVCKIKSCAHEKGFGYCFECAGFPCKWINDLEKSYRKRYDTSLIANSTAAKGVGIAEFLKDDREKWTCLSCGGVISLHDGVCSDCGAGKHQINQQG